METLSSHEPRSFSKDRSAVSDSGSSPVLAVPFTPYMLAWLGVAWIAIPDLIILSSPNLCYLHLLISFCATHNALLS